MTIPGVGVPIPDGAEWIVNVAGLMAISTAFMVFFVGAKVFATRFWKKKEDANNGDRRRDSDLVFAEIADSLKIILSKNGDQAVTKEEMSHMIKTQSPYIEDRNMIKDNLTKLNVSVKETIDEVKSLQVGQGKIHVKLDTILQNGRKDRH